MSEKAEIIQVPNTLRAKVGGKLAAIDPNLVEKAEAALSSLSENFGDWLSDEVEKLEAAQTRIRKEGYTTETAEALYFRCHDLKGLGTTYGYPIVTRLAGSACKMFDDPEVRMKAPRLLIDAHIDAIRAAVRGGIREENNPTGRLLAEALEARVREFLDSLKA